MVSNKKNSLGFTLVELLGVVTILAMLGLIIVPTINRLIAQNKQQLFDTQINNIKSAASNYVSDNILSIDIPLNESLKISLSDLKSGGYIDKDIADPISKSKFPDDLVILITNTKNGFSYIVCVSGVRCSVN